MFLLCIAHAPSTPCPQRFFGHRSHNGPHVGQFTEQVHVSGSSDAPFLHMSGVLVQTLHNLPLQNSLHFPHLQSFLSRTPPFLHAPCDRSQTEPNAPPQSLPAGFTHLHFSAFSTLPCLQSVSSMPHISQFRPVKPASQLQLQTCGSSDPCAQTLLHSPRHK